MTPSSPYLRKPTIAGDRLAFVADDDVWTCPTAGGAAIRVTADRLPVRALRWSPDGSRLAYVVAADGPPEVYVAEPGDTRRRLTWWADATTTVLGWSADGRVLAATAAGQPFTSATWAWSLDPGGSPPERLPFGPLTGLSSGPEGVLIGVDQNRYRGASWKRYRGGTAGRLWRQTPEGSERLLADLDGQIEDPQWCGGRVAFVSDHEGCANVYSADPTGGDLRRHSDHDRAYARAASSDGRRVVYQCAGDLWLLDELRADSTPVRLDIALASPRYGRAPQPVDAGEELRAVAPDREGRGALVEVRGGVVWLTHRDGPARILAPGGAVRGRTPVVLGAGRSAAAAWVSDAEGDDAIEVAPLDAGAGPPRRLATGRVARVMELAASPDGAWLAASDHRGAVRLVEVATGEVRVVDRSSYDMATGLAFSPDGAWLAWSHAGPGGDPPLRQLRLAPVAGGDVIEATPMRFADRAPVFTPDGRYLAFLSTRTFDPVYDEHGFEIGFPVATRPYLLALAGDTPSPLEPSPGGRAWPDPEPKSEPPGPVTVRVDPEGLHDRIVALPVAAGRLDGLLATRTGLAWRRLPVAGELGDSWADPDGDAPKAALVHLDLTSREVVTLLDGVDRAWSTAAGDALVVRVDHELRLVPATHPVDPAKGAAGSLTIGLDRVRLEIDPPAEWLQMYDEAARLMRDNYWVEDMAGVDWDDVVARYRPLVERLSSRDDLSEVIWEVQGELGTSHAYEFRPDEPVPPRRRQGQLGVDLGRRGDRWEVTAIPPPDSSVPGARSPMLGPGLDVEAGDAVVAVDGRAVDPATGPGPLLVGAAGQPVEVTVDGARGRRDLVVRPLADERPLRYHAWVADRREAVRSASAGRVGYVHVPDMQRRGWAELHRDLRLAVAAPGLVIDLRDNGGGHLSQLVLERLSRRITAWELPRDMEPIPYPTDAPRGPMAAVINQYAGSDGDIVSMGLRQRGLAPLFGMRTWGGVIGIDMRFHLVDGTDVTQPRYAFWFDGGAGWGVENHGVDPDVEVVVAPDDHAAGRDPQLDAAVAHVVDALDRTPVTRPPTTADRPDRRPPTLAPRPS